LVLLVTDWWWWLDRRGHRRAAAEEQGQYDRGGVKFGEGTSGARQCAAHRASRCPREIARWVGWLGGRAESRARRWLPGGGRGDSGSGEQATRPGQPVRVQALFACGEGLGTLERRCGHPKWEAHRGGTYGGRRRPWCSRAWRKGGFYGRLEAVEEVAWAPSGGQSRCGSRHGPNTADGASMCGRPSANDDAWAARRGRCASSTWHRPGDPHASCTGTRTRRSTHRAQACLGVRVRRVRWQADRPCTTSRARGVPARSGVKHFSLAPFDQLFLDFSQLKCHKQFIPKF
jgi:hypothetical protein